MKAQSPFPPMNASHGNVGMDVHEDYIMKEAPHSPAIDDDFNPIRMESEHLRDLENRNAKLITSLRDKSFNEEMLREVLESNTRTLEVIRHHIDSCIQSYPITSRPTTASAARAKEVFGMAELLEQILLYVAPRDILHAIQVSHATLNILKESPKLRERFSLRCDETGFFSSAFLRGSDGDEDESLFTDFDVRFEYWSESNGHDNTPNHRISITADFEAFSPLPKIGSRCRDMLICQPPIHVMQVVLHCCDVSRVESQVPRRWARNCPQPNSINTYGEKEEKQYIDEFLIANDNVAKTYKLKSMTGLTVGYVYGATKKLREAHALCHNASTEMHDEDGKVCPHIVFHTDKTLQPDDPIAKAHADRQIAQELEGVDKYRDARLLEAYVQAKGIGKSLNSSFQCSD